MKFYIYKYITCVAITLLMMVSCTFNDVTEPSTPGSSASMSVAFRPYIVSADTRATYPEGTSGNGIVGIIDNERLKETGFGVFAQHTGNDDWQTYTKTVPFNFMWNQQVTWDADLSWTYSPVKYWPNDNQPADLAGASGSQEHSYLNFFAYAPYVEVADPSTGFNIRPDDSDSDGKPDHDGIVAVSANSANVNASYIYYRTSNDSPFNPDESVDLLWATQQDLWKMKSSGEGYVSGQVNLPFRHALSKLNILVRTMIDRTEELTHDAYPTTLDANTKVFIESATVNTPTIYPEGKLMVGLGGTDPYWNYDEVAGLTGFSFDNVTDNDVMDVSYSLRYADPNVPAPVVGFIDSDHDGVDDFTGLTEAETVKEAFDAMESGVTDTEAQLAADYATLMFPPSATAGALSVRTIYHVVTYDPNLTLNSPKFYSNVRNDITATLSDNNFRFEANKQYKLLLNLGLTSVKFDIYVLDDRGEWILLSSVVKEWDLKTIEADVK